MPSIPEIIASYLTAYEDKDVPAMLDCVTDDIVFRNFSSGALTAEATGKPAFSELAEQGALVFETRRQEVTNAITVQDTTLMQITFTAVVAANPPDGWTAGQKLAFEGRAAMVLRDGRIAGITDEA